MGLLTVSNHIATCDDPQLMSTIAPWSVLLQPSRMRWGVCAKDVCFKEGHWLNYFTRAAKVLPVHRGGGVWQVTAAYHAACQDCCAIASAKTVAIASLLTSSVADT